MDSREDLTPDLLRYLTINQPFHLHLILCLLVHKTIPITFEISIHLLSVRLSGPTRSLLPIMTVSFNVKISLNLRPVSPEYGH